MKKAYIFRDEVSTKYVRSSLVANGELFHLIERPWLNNRQNISCIPCGVYRVDYMARSSSGKYKGVYWVRDVPGRSGILIHNGNIVAHSYGCLIVGMRRGTLAGQAAVLNSRSALSSLVDVMGRHSFELHIVGNQLCR